MAFSEYYNFDEDYRTNIYKPNDDDFFQGSPSQESIKISAFMCLYLYEMHKDIKFEPPFDPDTRENISKFVLITMKLNAKCFCELLEKMNIEDINKYVHELKVNIKWIYLSCKCKFPSTDIAYIWISAFVLEAILFLSNHQRPKVFVERTIEVLASIFNGIRLLVYKTYRSLARHFAAKKPKNWIELLQNVRSRIKAPLLLTQQDFVEIVGRYP